MDDASGTEDMEREANKFSIFVSFSFRRKSHEANDEWKLEMKISKSFNSFILKIRKETDKTLGHYLL